MRTIAKRMTLLALAGLSVGCSSTNTSKSTTTAATVVPTTTTSTTTSSATETTGVADSAASTDAASTTTTTGSSTSAAPAVTAAAPSGPPVKIMLIYEKSEGIANPDLPDGAQAAVAAVNAAGGVHGRPLELEVCDTRNDPNAAADCANKAVADGVVASVGNISQQTASYYPIFEAHHIPVIGESPASVNAFISPNSYPTQGGAVSSFAALGRFLADAGATKISLIRPDIAAGAQAKVFTDLGLKPIGQSVANDVAVPLDAPDMAQYAQQALADGVNGLVIALTGPQVLNVVQAARQIDPTIKIALISSNQDEVLSALGADATGLIIGDFVLPTSVTTAGTTRYVDEMKAAGFTTGGVRPLSWLAVHVFADVANAATDVTGDALIAALQTTTGLVTGVTPPLQWTTGNIGGIPRVFNACMLAEQVDGNGRAKVVTGKFFDPFAGAACDTPS